MDDAAFARARDHFLAGVAAQEAARWDEAEAQYTASLAMLPDRPSTLGNLGAVRLQRGDAAGALALLDRALALQVADALAHEHRALALVALQRDADALAAFEAAVERGASHAEMHRQHALCAVRLNRLAEAQIACERLLQAAPDDARGWALNGSLLKDLGRADAAVPALRRAIALGADPAVNGYLLASLEGGMAPPQPPPGYVQGLFDGYADQFEPHLLQQLQYRAPAVLVDRLLHAGARFDHALDLGCGTGLCGVRLRPAARRLSGVDLSGEMLRQARQRGVYDALVQADLAAHLQTTAEAHDAVIAADVFIYIGDLDAVFAGVRRVLQPEGVFCFSVEQADDAVDFELRPSSRYAQSGRYLRALALRHGFDVEAIDPGPLRLDQGLPVMGLYAWLRRR